MFVPYRHATAADYVTKQVENLILQEKFKPGDRLPTETALAASLGVGRSTVRESLKELERIGLIKTVRGSKGGRFISDVGGQVVGDTLKLLLQLKKVTLDDLMEARKINESMAAALAAERRRDEDLEAMCRSITSLEENLNNRPIDKVLFVEENYRFHHCIAEATGNMVLVITIQVLRDLIFKYFEPIPMFYDGPEVALRQHKGIYQAIKNKEAEQSRVLMIDHLEEFRLRSERFISRNDGG